MGDLQHYDAIVIGGGPVGLILSIGLAQQQKKVLLIERAAPKQSPSFDGRVLALTYASKLSLENLGVWSQLSALTTPIMHVHVSQKGYMGLTHIHATEMKVPALGYSVTASDLGTVLWEVAQQTAHLDLLTETGLVDFQQDDEKVVVQMDQAGETVQFQTQLLVGADGTQSRVREVLGLELNEKSYDAFGVIAKIETEQHPQGWSFERFTEEGPVALLPMFDHQHKAVMVVPSAKIEWAKSLSDAQFIEAFTEKMGARLGRFIQVGDRVAYPLKETYVSQMVKGRAVLMGNASHTQHPVAAQGLNLGIADIDDFLNLTQEQTDLGDAKMLQVYERKRQPHHEKIMGLTDGLINIFQNPSPVIGHLRGLGLMAMEALPNMRKRFARVGMGLNQ